MPALAVREDEHLLMDVIDSHPDDHGMRADAIIRFQAIMKASPNAYAARLGLAIASLRNGDRATAATQQHALYVLRDGANHMGNIINASRVLAILGDVDHARELLEIAGAALEQGTLDPDADLGKMAAVAIALGNMNILRTIAKGGGMSGDFAGAALVVIEAAGLNDRFERQQEVALKALGKDACGVVTEIVGGEDCNPMLLMQFRVNAPFERRRELERSARRALRDLHRSEGGITPAMRLHYHLIVAAMFDDQPAVSAA